MRWTIWTVVIVGVPTAALLLGKWIQRQQDVVRRFQAHGNFSQLRLALENYHDVYGTFPPLKLHRSQNGPEYSWRVALSEFVQKEGVFDHYDFSQPWNGTSNQKLAESLPEGMRWFHTPKIGEVDIHRTDFIGVSGPLKEWPVYGPCRTMTVSVGADSFTLIELPNSDIHWMEPRDEMNPRR
ncbi:MAG: DUF1559 domain-containing protein [Planctomycetaceae bacterium]